MVRVALAIVLAALIIACDRNSVAPADQLLAPVGPSAAITTTEDVSTVGPHATQGRLNVFVNMQDACDPVTFNQRGIACARPGGVNHAGNLKFQCCIHPWMRLEAVSGR